MSLLERCLQLGAIAKTVHHLLYLVRVIQTEVSPGAGLFLFGTGAGACMSLSFIHLVPDNKLPQPQEVGVSC